MCVTTLASVEKICLVGAMQNVTLFSFLLESTICISVVCCRGNRRISSKISFDALNSLGTVVTSSSEALSTMVGSSVIMVGLLVRMLSTIVVCS